MICYLAKTKGDRALNGQYYQVPALKHLCPVQAYLDWLMISELTSGVVFRSINRWGHISSDALYSVHSLRLGFANWATSNGWDIKTLMEYVGWKNMNSTMRYIDVKSKHVFQSLSILTDNKI